MAYVANAVITIAYVGNGAGPMTVPEAQSFRIPIAQQLMPGGDTVTAGNLNTLGTSIGTAAQTALNANITQITGWSTGGQ